MYSIEMMKKGLNSFQFWLPITFLPISILASVELISFFASITGFPEIQTVPNIQPVLFFSCISYFYSVGAFKTIGGLKKGSAGVWDRKVTTFNTIIFCAFMAYFALKIASDLFL